MMMIKKSLMKMKKVKSLREMMMKKVWCLDKKVKRKAAVVRV